jgi:hypothetical protein
VCHEPGWCKGDDKDERDDEEHEGCFDVGVEVTVLVGRVTPLGQPAALPCKTKGDNYIKKLTKNECKLYN